MNRMRIAMLLVIAMLVMALVPSLVIAESESVYPEKLTIFSGLSEHVSKLGATSNNDNVAFQEIERLTGTHVEWIHPAVGSDVDAQVNLLVASNSLPDIIVHARWKTFGGGPALWADDGIIYDLTDLIPENMPYYYALISDMLTGIQELSIDGRMYYISEIQHGYPFEGPIYRGDWMEKMQLPYPTTIDELYSTLVTLRDGDPNGNGQKDEWAMSGLGFKDGNFGPGHLLWAYGINYGFMQIDGKVTFGPLQPEFTDAMSFMNKLYSEGLLDPDYSTQDRNMLDGKYMNNQVSFEIGIQPSKMNNALAETGFKAAGGSNLRLTSSSPSYTFDNAYISSLTQTCDAAVTTANSEPDKVLRWLDSFYGGEGNLIANFGVEGLSYKIVDGVPQYDYTGALKLHPDIAEADVQYLYRLNGISSFPIKMSGDAYFTTLHPYSAEAILGWAADYDASRVLPSVSLTVEETDEINDTLVDLNTYMDVQYDRLVSGQVSISDIPAIQARLHEMGIDRCIEIYQAAYDRFMGK
ncbi:sugar ABC transporter permease [Clostridia bacterium]|nr:sugar ABC transporter permease [Clostridia bacterium]